VTASWWATIACAALSVWSEGCAEQPLPAQPLPPLVRDAPRERAPISVDEPLVIPGERLAWDVAWRGLSVGTLQLATNAQADGAPGAPPAVAMRSELRLHGFAARVAPVHHDLTTTVARAAVRGERARDVHGAVAILRAWSRSPVPPGYLMVRFRGARYRVDVNSPRAESGSIRVDGRVVRVGERQEVALSFTMWLSAEPSRIPQRLEAEHDGDHIVAELIDRAL